MSIKTDKSVRTIIFVCDCAECAKTVKVMVIDVNPLSITKQLESCGWKRESGEDYCPDHIVRDETEKMNSIPFPDFAEVTRQAKEHMKGIEDGNEDDDSPHYIFEAVLEAVYGKDVWNYIFELKELR